MTLLERFRQVASLPTPLQEVDIPLLKEKKIRLLVKRDDLIHPLVSGNKWRKLKYNLVEAKEKGHDTLLTFGGAFSNHIYSTAAAGKLLGFNTIGLIRGEETLPLNHTLSFASAQGMRLVYVDRETYRRRTDPIFLQQIQKAYHDPCMIPEGGSNALAVKGCAELVAEIGEPFDHICVTVGTGATLAGVIAGSDPKTNVIGIPVLKGAEFLEKDVRILLAEAGLGPVKDNWKLVHDFHLGGYAKISRPLVELMDSFTMHTGIALDPVYTGKMMYGIFSMIEQGLFKEGETIIAVHTGGLQGVEGMRTRMEKLRQMP